MEQKGKAVRSKRLPQPFVSITGITIENKKCRVCMKDKSAKDYPEAIDIFLDRDGLMSVCFDCINDIYDKFFISEGSLERALLKLCRLLNVAYLDEAVEAVKRNMETRKANGTMQKIWGMYKVALISTQHEEIGHRKKLYELNMTFVEPSRPVVIDPLGDTPEESELRDYWGEGLNYDDYVFLEKELTRWKSSYACDNYGTEVLMREICLKQLEIRKARIEGKSVDSILKSFDTLIKTANLSPAQQNAASSGKTAETLGTLIRRVEQENPCEYYDKQDLFKDYDNLNLYALNYIQRPVLNFLSGNKNFELIDSEEELNLDSSSGEDSEE